MIHFFWRHMNIKPHVFRVCSCVGLFKEAYCYFVKKVRKQLSLRNELLSQHTKFHRENTLSIKYHIKVETNKNAFGSRAHHPLRERNPTKI